jgi:hypothetical protein
MEEEEAKEADEEEGAAPAVAWSFMLSLLLLSPSLLRLSSFHWSWLVSAA